MSASISVGDGIPWCALTEAANESGETWSEELPAPAPVPVIETNLGHGVEGDGRAPTADVPTAMRALIVAVRRRIARGLLDVTKLRDVARLNERDASRADETGETRVAAWHRGQAQIWRDLADQTRESVRADEALLVEYERWASAGARP